jgi:glucosamine-6-phosphate isomerase/6-phosphogluconolactonase
MRPTIRIFPDADQLARFAARLFVSRYVLNLTIQVQFTVALSGGSTPKKMFEILGNDERLKKQVKLGTWDYVHFFWGEEAGSLKLGREILYRADNDDGAVVEQRGLCRFSSERAGQSAAPESCARRKIRAATIAGSIDSSGIGKIDMVVGFRSRLSFGDRESGFSRT